MKGYEKILWILRRYQMLYGNLVEMVNIKVIVVFVDWIVDDFLYLIYRNYINWNERIMI